MDERDMYASKWFDYRMMTPKTATLAFALEHFRALAENKKLLGDRPFEAVLASRKLDPSEPEKWRDWKSAVRLRRTADAVGMPYECFWEWAFEAYMDLKMQTLLTKKNTVFVPFNSFLNERLLATVLRKHLTYPLVRYSSAPFLQADAYEGHPIQVAYYDYLISILSKSRRNCTSVKLKELIDDGKISRRYLEKYRRAA